MLHCTRVLEVVPSPHTRTRDPPHPLSVLKPSRSRWRRTQERARFILPPPPAHERSDWTEEWLAELTAHNGTMSQAWGALPDAWYRGFDELHTLVPYYHTTIPPYHHIDIRCLLP